MLISAAWPSDRGNGIEWEVNKFPFISESRARQDSRVVSMEIELALALSPFRRGQGKNLFSRRLMAHCLLGQSKIAGPLVGRIPACSSGAGKNDLLLADTTRSCLYRWKKRP